MASQEETGSTMASEQKTGTSKEYTMASQEETRSTMASEQKTGTSKCNDGEHKIVNDPVHGHIRVDPLCVKIIDTPQFQRLRYLKQLGAAYFVYPGAAHNRFEHSIGVYHLAGEFARTLQKNQPELEITDDDILCIEIAGLCHDLGHGPFSHVFENRFMSRVNPDSGWKHEETSLEMLRHLIDSNSKVKAEFEKRFARNDRIFIEELINPPVEKTDSNVYPFEGREKDKSFLYEIVSNKRNGIDVDKWDYFARDCHMLGIRNNFDHKRYMMFARVIDVDGTKQICMRDQEASNIYGMFSTRANLHRKAYQHKVVCGIDLMIADAMVAADGCIKIPGKEAKRWKMSDCFNDMEAYTKITDGILEVIRLHSNEKLKKSQDIIRDLHSRHLYKCIGESINKAGNKLTKEDTQRIRKEIVAAMTPEDENSENALKEDDIEIVLMKFDFGMKNKDPVESVWFYKKSSQDKAFQVETNQVSHLLPKTFEEQVVAVYSKDPKNSEKHHIIEGCFQRWCRISALQHMEEPTIWLKSEGK